MKAALSSRIVFAAVVSVTAALVLLLLGVLWMRPILRDVVVRELVASIDVAACEAAPERFALHSGSFSVYAYDRSGQSANPDAPPLEADLLARARFTGELAHTSPLDDPSVAVVMGVGSGPCQVVRLTSRPLAPSVFRNLSPLMALIAVGSMGLAGAGTWLLVVLPLRRRIEQLASAANTVGATAFVRPPQPADALGQIADVLERSHARIVETREALVRRNEALEDHLTGIAHDLRTPLSSMQLALEAVTDEAEGELQDSARRALADLVYLSSLVENLHQAARLRHDVSVSDGKVDLTDLVLRLEQRFAAIGRHAGVEVAANVRDEPVWALCNPAFAERATANVVQNAIEHQDGAGHVALLLTADDEQFELAIIDDGPGLPEPVRASLDEATFLTEASRSRGPGLGMLITAEVARRARWTVTYAENEPSGLRVTIRGTRLG